MQSQKKTVFIGALLLTNMIILFLILNWISKASQPTEPGIDHFSSKHSKNKRPPFALEGPAWFAEYHRQIRTRAGESEPAYEPAYRFKEFRKSLEKRKKSLTGDALNWIERGPANVGGRTRSIWVDPTDTTHLTWFAGSVSGGVWKTENGGVNWRHLTEELSNLATSVIMGSAANPDVLYVGTGEWFNYDPGVAGNGIWKSVDRGESWFPLESTLNNSKFAHTMRIAVNPNNEQEMVVASRLGRTRDLADGAPRSFIHKSTDGGQSWRETWRDSLIVQQVVAHPHNFDTLFAAVHGGGVLRSFNAGLSWHTVLDVRSSSMERIELAVSPTDPDYVYFAVFTQEYQSLLYSSTDGGDSWREVRGKNLQNEFGNWMRGQGNYNNTIAVHPYDPRTVFVGGAGPILKITVPDQERKALMEPLTDGYEEYRASTKGVHVDHHALIFIPIDQRNGRFYILNANDGGVAFSTDSGETFTQTGDTFKNIYSEGPYPTFYGYNASQFYGVDKMNGADRYVGGTQDNDSWVSGPDPDSSSKWINAPTGDGFEVAWHYRDPDKILTSFQFSRIRRSDDRGLSWRDVQPPSDNIFGRPFFTRLANSKIDPDLVFCVTKQGVARSFDFANSWEVVPMPSEWQFSAYSNLIRVSLADPSVVWTGLGLSGDNRIFVSKDGGSTFSATNFYEAADLGVLSGLATHPFNKKTAYALFSAADAPKILKTVDMGENWEDVSGFVTNAAESANGFPDAAVYSLLVMPFDTNQIWVGTEIGLFESLDGGLSWQYADNGLPPVSTWEMKIVNDEVVLATHGRGVWTVSLPELEDYEPPEAIALIPLLSMNENGLGGRISGTYLLRSDYDSVVIEVALPINGQQNVKQRFSMESNQALEEGVFNLLVDVDGLAKDTIVNARVGLLGYREGKVFKNVKESLIFKVEEEAQIAYVSDFDEGANDFARLDFNIYQEAGFDSKALHSRHPYLGFYQTYLAVLNIPIIVSSAYPLISYDEIAMIEPGEEGTVFGDDRFWDYAAVEGTRDLGQSWQVIEAYDSRWSNDWVNNYVSGGGPVDPALMKTHTMDLASVFNPGDTVFLRFRLQSDPYTEGWGWMIDNLSIQQDPATNAKEREMAPLNITIAPNPSTDVVRLQYTLEEKQAVKITVHSISGQYLAALENGTSKPAGVYEQIFKTADLSPGVYLFRFQVDDRVKTLKWLKQ